MRTITRTPRSALAAFTLLAWLVSCPPSVLAQSNMSPEMKAAAKSMARACRSDYGRYCKDVQRGEGRVLACLRDNAASLSPSCSAALQQVGSLAGAAGAGTTQ